MNNNIQNTAPAKSKETSDNKSKILWTLLFLVIAVATVWAVTSQNRSFSHKDFIEYIKSSSKPWLAAALAGTLGFIIFEGQAVITVCRSLGYDIKSGRGFIYSAADIYFSAITPSATGGQPACAYFMMSDGIPGAVTTAVLVANLTMYSLSIIVLGLLSLIVCPQVFWGFGTLSKVLIVSGIAVQIIFFLFLMTLLKHGSLLQKLCSAVLHFLAKIHLIRHETRKQAKLVHLVENYHKCSEIMRGKKKILLKVFFFNFLQRSLYVAVTLFTFLSSGGSPVYTVRVLATQSLAIIGSNSIPIPGAMGVSDYLMLDGFQSFMSSQNAANLELLSRSLSFYICIVICGLTVLFAHMFQKRRKTK